LEAELEALTPSPMSEGVAERIGRQLREEPAPVHRLRLGHRFALVGLAAAACVIVVAFIGLWGDPDGRAPVPGLIAETQRSDPAVIAAAAAAAPLPPPSLGAYQRALANSPDALDSLLDAHAPRVLGAPGGGPQTAKSFRSSRTQLSTLNGDTL
jgi:hypothetical protein